MTRLRNKNFIKIILSKVPIILLFVSVLNDFDFNQEIDYDKPSRSPGWERLKQAKQNKTNFNKISYSNNNTIFKVGESVNHEDFGNGKVIHIEDNKVIINFKKYGEKKIIDKFIKKSNEQN